MLIFFGIIPKPGCIFAILSKNHLKSPGFRVVSPFLCLNRLTFPVRVHQKSISRRHVALNQLHQAHHVISHNIRPIFSFARCKPMVRTTCPPMTACAPNTCSTRALTFDFVRFDSFCSSINGLLRVPLSSGRNASQSIRAFNPTKGSPILGQLRSSFFYVEQSRLAVFHEAILYQWAYYYYLISAPLFLGKNLGEIGVFLEMPLSLKYFEPLGLIRTCSPFSSATL